MNLWNPPTKLVGMPDIIHLSAIRCPRPRGSSVDRKRVYRGLRSLLFLRHGQQIYLRPRTPHQFVNECIVPHSSQVSIPDWVCDRLYRFWKSMCGMGVKWCLVLSNAGALHSYIDTPGTPRMSCIRSERTESVRKEQNPFGKNRIRSE